MEHKTLVDAVVTAEWEMFTSTTSSASKGRCPESISYIITPTE